MKRISVAAAICVAAAAALLTAPSAVGADPAPAAEKEQWGPEVHGLRMRLVPLAKKYVLWQPMRFRLEMWNFGQHKTPYERQHLAGNSSWEVRDAHGKPVWSSSGHVSTFREGPSPSLAPGAMVVILDRLDLNSQFSIVKPGKYTVQFHGYHGILDSNTAVIDVQPGPLSPAVRVVRRFRDVLPKGWELAFDASPSRDVCLAGWEGGRLTFFLTLTGPAAVELYVLKHRMVWTGKVDYPGQRAMFYLGQCPEGYVYADLPTNLELQTAKWPTLREDIWKALQIVPEKSYPPSPDV